MFKYQILTKIKQQLSAKEIYRLGAFFEEEYEWIYQRNTNARELAERIGNRFSRYEIEVALEKLDFEFCIR